MGKTESDWLKSHEQQNGGQGSCECGRGESSTFHLTSFKKRLSSNQVCHFRKRFEGDFYFLKVILQKKVILIYFWLLFLKQFISSHQIPSLQIWPLPLHSQALVSARPPVAPQPQTQWKPVASKSVIADRVTSATPVPSVLFKHQRSVPGMATLLAGITSALDSTSATSALSTSIECAKWPPSRPSSIMGICFYLQYQARTCYLPEVEQCVGTRGWRQNNSGT